MIGLLLGIVLGVSAVFLVRRLDGEPWMYAYALLVLPFVYIVFAVVNDAPNTAGKEFVAGVPFIAAGIALLWFRFRYATMIVGAFWILHAIYDVVHDDFFINRHVPDWYPLACFGTDVVIGGYLLWLGVREKRPAAV
ncbi:hypothetical protein GCM10022234_20480 [Aeromicrobium panaciterrae]|uniref:hypothetical protein n=1 Tax=Aeromicrobium panaciterrae TaxID=363861 RepID=UPI0031DC906D